MKPDFHDRVHNSPTLFLSCVNPAHALPSYYITIYFNIISPSPQRLPSSILPSTFPTDTVSTSRCTIHATFLAAMAFSSQGQTNGTPVTFFARNPTEESEVFPHKSGRSKCRSCAAYQTQCIFQSIHRRNGLRLKCIKTEFMEAGMDLNIHLVYEQFTYVHMDVKTSACIPM